MLPFEIKELTRALILECQSRKIKLTYFIKIATWEQRPIRNNFEVLLNRFYLNGHTLGFHPQT